MSPRQTKVDVVVVAYSSAETIRRCVSALAGLDGVRVTVVDNASPDDVAAPIADLDVEVVDSGRNGGFAFGCNRGTALGVAPYVLLLNPDARIERASLDVLSAVLDRDPRVGLVAPLLIDGNGQVARSQFCFPRLRSTYAQSLFLHRILPHVTWTDETIHDHAAYLHAGAPDWVSGACMLVRRDLLERLGGLDERFFMYCEDADLCARIRDLGSEVRFEPAARAEHAAGHSAPRSSMLGVLARSRLLYVQKHRGHAAVLGEMVGIALGHALRALGHRRDRDMRAGHIAAIRALRARTSP